jgi:hypothetical protein
VCKKYGLTEVELGVPQYIDFVIIPEGSGSTECSYGEVWTQLNVVRYLSGAIPENARWCHLDMLPANTLEYHRTVLLPRISKYLLRG